MIGAFQLLAPRYGATTLDLLPLLVSSETPFTDSRLEARRLAGVLIKELQENFEEPVTLILDDLHFITNPLTLSALDFLLERLPQTMTLVISTRRDPPLSWPRYRARRRLAELRLTDLRFTVVETGDLLNEALGLKMPQETFDYLSDEVLHRQPQEIQTFLLQTSILHILTPQQCTAVTGLPDTEDILEDLYRHNVFILAEYSEDRVTGQLSGKTRSYRYHALFAEFLRHRLIREQLEQVPELHRRAAASEIIPGRAIHHYAQAGMWDKVASVINTSGLNYLRQGRLDLLSGWIDLLPEATRLAHPRLAYLMGLCELQKGEPIAAERWLDEALRQAQLIGNKRI